jgi:hypothetical protein
MHWKKLGKIFDPTTAALSNGFNLFAQSPQTIVFDDYVRIYFSTRKQDTEGKYLSHISFVDFDTDLKHIIGKSAEEVIGLGALGTFDEHGIFPINPFVDGDQILAYTCGWSRRVSVSVETGVGIVKSNDGGKTFYRLGDGPILSATLKEPVLVGDAFVQKYDGVYHMWYIFGTMWKAATATEPEARVYKIAYAKSKDGLHWIKKEGKPIIANVLNEEECQALPTVTKIGERYHMYFCYREATDFRKNSSRGYRLGYAYSDDLIHWTRDDANKGIEVTPEDWDSDMMCYPHIFQCKGKIYLLYNGNEFGRYGFGLAVLEKTE